MAENPYAEAASRIFSIVACVIGLLCCLYLVVASFLDDQAPRLGRLSAIASGNPYTLAHNPSQFWFGVLFYLVVGAAFGYGAWRAYRG